MSKNKDYSKFYNKPQTPENKEVVNAPIQEEVKEVQAIEPVAETVTTEPEEEVKEVVKKKYAIVAGAAKVNMRADISTDAPVITVLASGTKVEILDQSANGAWNKIAYKDMTGFMMSQFLKEIK